MGGVPEHRIGHLPPLRQRLQAPAGHAFYAAPPTNVGVEGNGQAWNEQYLPIEAAPVFVFQRNWPNISKTVMPALYTAAPSTRFLR